MINKLLHQILASPIHGKMQKSHTKTIDLKYQTLKEEFELPDWSYTVSDIQDYFEYIIK